MSRTLTVSPKTCLTIALISVFLKKVVVVALPLVLAFFGSAQQINGQIANGKERVVENLRRRPTPFKVKNIKTKKGEFLLGQKLVDGDDWFNGLSVVLENVSGKTVIYVGAGFLFPTQRGEVGKYPPLYKSLMYGHHPNAPEEATLNIKPLELKSGETFVITLSNADYDEVTANLKRLEYPQTIRAIKFNLMEVYFSDGTAWPGGTRSDRFSQDRNSNIRKEQPISVTSERFPRFIGGSLINPAMFSSPFFFIKNNLKMEIQNLKNKRSSLAYRESLHSLITSYERILARL